MAMLSGLSLKDKKDIVFATRLRFGAEMKVPRERAIDLMVEKALYFADETHPFGARHIVEVFHDIWRVPAIRHQVIRASLDRLSKAGRALQQTGGYVPSDALSREISEELGVAARSLDDVVSRVFGDLDVDWGRRDIKTLFLGVIADVFSQFGSHWVKSLAGGADSATPVRTRDLERLIERRFDAEAISDDLRPVICARIVEFFKDTTSVLYNGVKFNFAQGFYVAKLIGYNAPVDVLSADLYNGAVFCLDSNVVLAVLVVASRHSRSIRELAALCERLNSRLVVTEETLEEATYVVEHEEKLAARVYDRVPLNLVPKTKGHFFQAYRQAKDENFDLTVEEFFAPFRRIRQVLKDELKAEIVAASYGDFSSDPRLPSIKHHLQEASRRVRDVSKKEGALRHDAVHYLWVQQARRECSKTWFVTLDRSLPVASARIKKSDVPFALNLDGLLQSLSTFLAVDDHSYAGFSQIFSRLIAAQMTPLYPIFDVADFAIFDDLGMDCSELPAEDVDRALAEIKKSALKGAPYADGAREEAMYALRTFFAVPEKRMRMKIAEKDRELEELRERLEFSNRDLAYPKIGRTKQKVRLLIWNKTFTQENSMSKISRKG